MRENATLARPYAKAIFAIAKEHKTTKEWGGCLFALSEVVEAIKPYLHDHRHTFHTVSDVFVKTLSPKLPDPLLKNFIEVLVKKKRLVLLPEIAQLYDRLRLHMEGKVKATLFSPDELDENQKLEYQRLIEQQFSRKAEMTYQVNESLLGGYRAVVGNYIVDGSVPGLLNQMKNQMGK